MSALRVPPDGIIARHFADREEGMKADMKRYLRDGLICAMRGDSLPQPQRAYKVKAIEAVHVRQRAVALVSQIEPVRAGEAPLPRDAVQEALDF